jgi:hypothetical protein
VTLRCSRLGLGGGASRIGSAGSVALLVLGGEAIARLAYGAPYPGATELLIAACGIASIPWLPRVCTRISIVIAAVPVLGVGLFPILLTTCSVVGIPLTELSIRLNVVVVVVLLSLASLTASQRKARGQLSASRADVGAALGLAVVVGYAIESALDVVGRFPPRGADWGHYLLYSEQVASTHRLLTPNPYWQGGGTLFGDDAGIGALYGAEQLVSGFSSEQLGPGIALLSALTPLSVFVALGGLWGLPVGLLGAATYAVAPIRLQPLYWHGLATVYAILFLPLLLLGVGLLFREERDGRAVVLTAFSIVAVATVHRTSAVFGALALALAAALLLGRVAVDRRRRQPGPVAGWPLLVGRVVGGVVLGAALLGAGVIAHIAQQAADLGPPPGYKSFGAFDLKVFVEYLNWQFLALSGISLLILACHWRALRDPAMWAVALFIVAAVLLSQLGALHMPFAYWRAAHYIGVPLVALVALACFCGKPGRSLRLVVFAVVVAYFAHLTSGLNVMDGWMAKSAYSSTTRTAIAKFRQRLSSEPRSERAANLVADSCWSFAAPYLFRRPTWGVVGEVISARELVGVRVASRILRGRRDAQELIKRLRIGYAITNPSCTPDVAEKLLGRIVLATDSLVVVKLRSRSRAEHDASRQRVAADAEDGPLPRAG